MLVASADALVGGMAAAIPASISDTLSEQDAVPLLCLVGLMSGRPRSQCAVGIAVTG